MESESLLRDQIKIGTTKQSCSFLIEFAERVIIAVWRSKKTTCLEHV